MNKRSIFLLIFFFSIMSAEAEPYTVSHHFKRGTHKGTSIDIGGNLTFYSFSDDFSNDSREDYAVIAETDSGLNEFGHLPFDDRAYLSYSFKKKALFMEAGSGDRISIKKETVPLSDFVLSFQFVPVAVYPGNGHTIIDLYSNDRIIIASTIYGETGKPAIVTFFNSEKNISYTSNIKTSYSGIGRIAAARGEQVDRYELFNPEPIHVILCRENGIFLLYIGNTEIIKVKDCAKADITAFQITFKNQEGFIDNIAVVSLKGSYSSGIQEIDPFAKESNLDIVYTIPQKTGSMFKVKGQIKTAYRFKDLLRVSWGNDKNIFSKFPSDVSLLCKGQKFARYHIEFSIDSQYCIKNISKELPIIKFVFLKQMK